MQVCAIGEPMAELYQRDSAWQLAYGGDMLNFSVHLSRLGVDVAFFSAIGRDPISSALRERWVREGVDLSLLQEHPTRNIGLYAISTDARGERSFVYWRGESAAREMFDLPSSRSAMEQALASPVMAFSLITLAVLGPDQRRRLLDMAAKVRANGGMVVFDGNYRPCLWASAEAAAAARDEALAHATIGLPTFDDELALGLSSAESVLEHWMAHGCSEVAVKLGRQGCLLADGGIVQTKIVDHPVDTSGAGDSFNAAYVASRLKGHDQRVAATAGNRLAGWVVTRHGATPPQSVEASYKGIWLCREDRPTAT